jgi:hypothetical protein
MKLSNNAVTAVLHDKNSKYIRYFEKNLNSKKKTNFDIIIFCHGAKKKYLNYKNFKFIYLEKNLSIIQVRKYIFNHLIKKKYKKVMFSDLEDFYKLERAEATFKNLKNYDIVFNNINLLKKNNFLTKNIFNNSIKSYKNFNYLNIIKGNLLGFCNTGVKVKYLANMPIPNNIIAIDWWIFSIILIKKKKVKFLKNISSNYRIDNSNILGMSKKMDKKKLNLLINIKLNHYLSLVNFCSKYSLKHQKKIYTKNYNYIKKLGLLTKNNQLNKAVIKEINKKKYNFSQGWFNELPSKVF